MRIIVGLGNPGTKYKRTRHNVGFIILNELAERLGLNWAEEKKFNAEIARGEYEGEEILLVKPLTYMNLSGECVSLICSYYKEKLENIIVIHDEVDLPFGEIRKQFARGTAGHHGIENIVEKLGTNEFFRIRIGVGRPEDKRYEVNDWVLSDFTEEELNELKKIKIGEILD